MGKIVNRSNRVFLGPEYKTFEEAFPEVKNIRFEYTIAPTKPWEIGTSGTLTKENMVGVIRCPNKLCTEGGFEIDLELSLKVFSKKLARHKGIVFCSGHEHMGSRWKTRKCAYHLTYRVKVEYHS